MVLLFDERIFEMTAQKPEDHIKNPYTLAEIKTKIASNDYNAEMLLQHARHLDRPPPGRVEMLVATPPAQAADSATCRKE